MNKYEREAETLWESLSGMEFVQNIMSSCPASSASQGVLAYFKKKYRDNIEAKNAYNKVMGKVSLYEFERW